MNSTGTGMDVIQLASARVKSLSTEERCILAKKIRHKDEFIALGVAELSYLVGRPLNLQSWDPGSLLKAAEADAEYCERQGIRTCVFNEDAYPPLLRETSQAPYLLFYRGQLPPQDRPLLGIVGTREPSRSGYEAAYALGRDSARAGIPVVSGLARGIDAAAHDGCIAGKQPTYAVGGAGIDRVYPASNRRLAELILDSGGALISEYPPGMPPQRYHFPERNRIIAGLSRGVVVVEAPESSGALITADHALDEGRDLWVHADGLSSPRGEGGRLLHAAGSPVLHGVTEIVAEWEKTYVGLNANTELSEIGRPELVGAPSGRQAGRRLARELSLELGLEIADE